MEEKQEKKRGRVENLKKFSERSPEEQREIHRKGQIAATEAKRRKKELATMDMAARDFVRYFMAQTATPQRAETLKMLGLEEDECINMNVFVTALFSKAVKGDTKASELLMTLGGYTGEENRRNAEEERKNRESIARIEALKANMGKIDVESGDDEGSVMIYLPEIEKPEQNG